jgi:hypothetical protein
MVGLFAMISTLAALRLLAGITKVSSFALNLTLVLGCFKDTVLGGLLPTDDQRISVVLY